jgi:L-malate glycosyltransferase
VQRAQNGRKRRQPVVCQLVHTLHVGGAEVLATRLGRQLRQECRFIYVCLDEEGTMAEDLRAEGFAVQVLGRREGLDWHCALRLAKIFDEERVDLVHAHQYGPFFYAMLARLLERRPAVLFTEHGRHFPDFPRPKRKMVNRLLLESRDRVVGVGQAVRLAVIRNEGIPAARVGMIYNGIDAPPVGETNGFDRNAVLNELGCRQGDFVILQVARLDYLKDHATAVRMMKRLVIDFPNAKLLLVGDGVEKQAIKQLIEAHGVGENVRLLGLRQDIGRLLKAADLFLLTSISEGIPLTVIEAMAAGLPVVATRVGGMAEVVVHGETGLLGPSGDDAAMAALVDQLVRNEELRRQMGLRGQMRARSEFSESRMHARYLDLYREMLRN